MVRTAFLFEGKPTLTCFSQITETNGALARPPRTQYSASTSTPGTYLNYLGSPIDADSSSTCNSYGGYGGAGWGKGVRNFVFKSPDPKVPVDTWIRLEAGEVRARVTLDDKYGR